MVDNDELKTLWLSIENTEQKISDLQAEINSIRAEVAKLGSYCNPVLNQSIRNLDLPERTLSCLARGSNIKTIAELVVAYKDHSLKNVRNFGPAALASVEKELSAKNLLTDEVYAEALFLVGESEKPTLTGEFAENLLDDDGVFLENILALEHQHKISEDDTVEINTFEFFQFCDSLPSKTLLKLLTYLSPGYRIALAAFACQTDNEELIVSMSQNKDPYIRRAFAVVTTNQKILNFYALEDEDEGVRMAVANNKHTNPVILAYLANDENEDVRNAVANNKNTEACVLERLAAENRE